MKNIPKRAKEISTNKENIYKSMLIIVNIRYNNMLAYYNKI